MGNFISQAYAQCDESRVACDVKQITIIEFYDVTPEEVQKIIQLAKDENRLGTDWNHDEEIKMLQVTFTNHL